MLSDLDRLVVVIEKQPKANAARIGITGMCRGGHTVWMYTAHSPKIKAAVAWYGPLTQEEQRGLRAVSLPAARADLAPAVLPAEAGGVDCGEGFPAPPAAGNIPSCSKRSRNEASSRA